MVGGSAWADSVVFEISDFSTGPKSVTKSNITVSSTTNFKNYGSDFDITSADVPVTFSASDGYVLNKITTSHGWGGFKNPTVGNLSGDVWTASDGTTSTVTMYTTGWCEFYSFNVEFSVASAEPTPGGSGGGDSSDAEVATFDFTTSSITCIRGGNNITLNSSNDTANGDKFMSNGVTMSLSGSTTGWLSTRAAGVYALYVKSGTSFTIAAPESAELSRIEIECYSGNTNTITGSGLSKSGNTFTWTGNSESVTFTSGDCYIRTMRVSYVASDLDPIEYTVHLFNAPGDATISIAGVDGTYGNNARVSIAKHLSDSDITAEYAGYNTSVEVSGTDINVTYTVKGAVTDDVVDLKYTNGNAESAEGLFTVNSVGGNSNGLGTVFYGNNTITVTAAGKNISKIVLVNGYTGSINFSNNSFTATPNGLTSSTNGEFTWQNSGNGEVEIVTFSIPSNSTTVVSAIRVYTAALTPTDYTVTFAGETVPDGAAVTIDGTQYTPSNSSFSTTKALSESSVSNVYENDDYYATVAYNEGDHSFTVTYYAYTKYSVAVAAGSEYSGAEAGVVVSGATYGNGTYLVGTNNIKSKGALQQSNFAAKEVARYDGTVTLEGNTATVNYTVKVVPPFTITQVSPGTGTSQNRIQSILLYAPTGKSFILEDQSRQIDLTFTNTTTSESKTVKAQYLCNYEGYAQLLILQQYGANYFTGSFSEAGTWAVTIPAGVVNATDGSTNSEKGVIYTIEASAQQTGATPANNSNITNNDIIGGSFAINFDKNISSYDIYHLSVQFPNGTTAYLNNVSGLGVSVNGSSVVFSPSQTFWNTYADRLRQNGTLRFSIETDAVTDVNGIPNAMSAQVSYNYTYVVPETTVASTDPEVGTYSLDDREYGFNDLQVTFADNFAQNVSIQGGDALPAGMTLNLPAGVTHGQIWANSGTKVLHVGLTNANVAGDYQLQIAKGTFQFENATFGEGVNAAVDQTWTLTAATTFRVNSWSGVSPSETVKSLESFTVSAPDGMTFAEPANANVVLSVREGYEGEETPVTATMSLVDGSMVFTFPTAYDSKGSVYVTVPAGAISTTDNLTSKEFEASFIVDPFDYFNFVSTVPAEDSNVDGPVNTITLTLPAGKTVKTVGESINVNWIPVAVTSHEINGDDVVLHLATALPYSQYNTINIPEAFIVTTDEALSKNLIYYNVYVNKVMLYASANVNGETTTTNSVTVEKFSNVEIYFDEPFDEYVGGIPAGMTLNKGAENVAITAGWTQKQTWEDAYYDYKYHSFYFYFNEISAPGTYTVHIPAGVFTSAAGHQNEEVNLDIVIPTPDYFAAMTVSPADGETMESLRTITLTAPDDVTFDDVKGLQGRVTVNDDSYNYPSSIEFADDKKSVTFNISEKTADGEYTVTFPAGFVRSTDGKWSPELTATYTVSYPWFTLSAPRGGEVGAIKNITINAPANVVLDTPASEVTIVVNGVNTQVGASLNADGNIVLAYNATKADLYEISIPAETFTAAEGTKKNKELTGITYTIQPSLAINANAKDDEGNYWTSFCLNKDFTLEDGYKPYIVVDNGEGGIKLVELLGTPIVDTYNCYFNSAYGDATEHTDHNGTINSSNIAGKYQVTYESNQTYNDGGYYDITYGYKNLVFTIKVLDGAQAPSNAGAHYYNPTYSTKVESTFEQVDENTYTVTVENGHANSYVGGLYIEVATGDYNTPIVPANTGILVKGTKAGAVAYTQANGTKADVSGNLLRGCTQSATWEDDSKLFYRLTWAAGDGYEDLGFYWDVEGGHSVRANAGKAYLVLDANQTNSNRMLIFGGHEETPTAIDSVVETSDDAPIFTLQGKRVSRENLPAGVYVQNGRKFIVK